MSLQDEINNKANQIFKDSYQMSIGELINLYRDYEMDIHPEFQRVFRWSEYQKTKLIESIMLNIPIPPIFVSQNEDGVWDIIDGVQRLSTIFQFVGIFKDEDDNILEPLTLLKTDYLPSFAGVKWESDTKELSFSKEQQLFFKRSRIDVVIMKKESDPNTKYELFQRLNTGGSKLSDQEVRNCLMIMTSKSFYEFVVSLDQLDNYKSSLPLTDKKTDEQYRMELIIRILVAKYINWDEISKYTDFAELLDKEVLKLCELEIDYDEVKNNFDATFSLLYGILGEDAFKRYNGTKHLGPVMVAAFQTIAFGVSQNIERILTMHGKEEWLNKKIQKLYEEDIFMLNITPGVRSIPRYKELSLFGVDYFRP